MEHADLSALGKPATAFAGFDTFPIDDEVNRVEFRSNELTALCPVTGQPDFYDVEVSFYPNGLTIEAKTFKLYLQSFREAGVTCEALAAQIARDVRDATEAFCTVELAQHVRGGVAIVARAQAFIGDDLPHRANDDEEGDDVPWA